MNWSKIQRILPQFFGASILALIIVSGSFFVVYQSKRSVHAANHTYEVIGSLESLISQMKDAETYQRGYILTGDSSYVEPFDQTVAHLQDTLGRSRSLLQADPAQLERLRQIQEDTARKTVELRVGMERRRMEGLPSALQLVKTGMGESLMDHIRATIDQMETEERLRISSQLIASDRLLNVTGILIGLLVILLMASTLSLVFQIYSRQKAQEKTGHALNAWKSSEDRFHLLIEGLRDYALYMLDPEGHVTTWPKAAERIKGYRADEIIGSHFSRFFRAEDIASGQPQHLLKMASANGSIEMESWRLRKDGTPFWAHILVTAIKDDSGRLLGYAKLVRDATEQKKTEKLLQQKEEELVRSRKLEALGRLAGGVSHDFNNLMTGITGICEELAVNPTLAHVKEEIQEIAAAARRATLLTQQLLAFSRRQVRAPVVLNINDVVSDTQKMLRRMIGEDIEIRLLLDPHLGHIRADHGQMEQILVNLAVNARDAMPRGGHMTIKTDNFDLVDNTSYSHLDLPIGVYVMLTFSDNGTGIPPEIQSHIFEPFFTTKENGKGTGLGLATVYGIVKQNGGDIALESEQGKGTTFKIYLPRVSDAVTYRPEKTMPAIASRGGRETILLVEDEKIVRKVVARALAAKGYTVLTADQWNEALDLVSRHPSRIDLLLTDVVMPGFSGPQLVERLKSLQPDLKVLYMSGYTENTIVERGILKPGIAFIEKTFTGAMLCEKVRHVLDTPASELISTDH